MDWNHITVGSALGFVVGVILAWLIKPYIDSYLKKKGENKAVFEDGTRINRQTEGVRSEFVGPNAYAAEKAKAAATKEDIQEITRKIEEVKNSFSTQLELLKWELSMRATLYRLAAEKQFEALAEIGRALYEMELSTRRLRPALDHFDPDEPEEERYRRRWGKWAETRNDFMDAVEKNKLFLPQDVYAQFNVILRLSEKESIDFQACLAYGEGRLKGSAYLQGQKNIDEMDKKIREALTAIRQRYGIEG